MIRIVCCGAGSGYETFTYQIDPEKAEIIGIIDKRTDIQDEKIISMEDLDKIEYDYVVVTSSKYQYEMHSNLIMNGCPEEKIVHNCMGSLFDDKSFLTMKKIKRKDINLFVEYFPDNMNPSDSEDHIRTLQLSLITNTQKRLYDVEGDLAELGVWRGDFSRQMSYLYPDRKIWLFDTFEGFDARDTVNKDDFSNATENSYTRFVSTSVDMVLEMMPYPEKCIVRKGWFPDSAADIGEDQKYALVSLDADLYDPIFNGLSFFYPRLSVGGVIMIHDYNGGVYSGAKRAVDEFALAHNLFPVPVGDWGGTALIIKQ